MQKINHLLKCVVYVFEVIINNIYVCIVGACIQYLLLVNALRIIFGC